MQRVGTCSVHFFVFECWLQLISYTGKCTKHAHQVGGHGLSGFGDSALFQIWSNFPFWTMDFSPWRLKNRIGTKYS